MWVYSRQSISKENLKLGGEIPPHRSLGEKTNLVPSFLFMRTTFEHLDFSFHLEFSYLVALV